MKFLQSVLLFFLSLMSSSAFCNEISECSAVPELKRLQGNWPNYHVKECECGTALHKYQMKAPVGLRLVAVCGYRADEVQVYGGGFFFVGSLEIKGELKYRDDPYSGARLHFSTRQEFEDNQIKYGVRSMKFDDEEKALKLFNIPSISNLQPCWKAEATMKVKNLLLMEGGTDESGGWPLEYEVVNVGPYKRCETGLK